MASNVRALPHHYSRVNASEPLPSDKRQFIHPPPPLQPHFPAISTPSLQSTVPSVTAASFVPAEAEQASTASSTSTALPALSFATPPSSPPPPTPANYNHKPTPPQPSTSPPSPTTLLGNTESSERYPDATRSQQGRNQTAGEEGEGSSQGDSWDASGPWWRVAVRTSLAVVAISVTALLSCCCSLVLMASWRGQRKRTGRYRAAWRGQRGSMTLIEYTLVRENT